MQGNVNFLFLNLILHMYFWLSIQRISLTFYGYLLHVWYILFIHLFLFLARNTYVNVVSHKLSLKLFKSQSQYQCKFSLFYSSCLDHSHATVVSLVELLKNFTHILWSCATYLVYFTRFWLGTHAWTSLLKNCVWNCYKTLSKYQQVYWNSTYVEKI